MLCQHDPDEWGYVCLRPIADIRAEWRTKSRSANEVRHGWRGKTLASNHFAAHCPEARRKDARTIRHTAQIRCPDIAFEFLALRRFETRNVAACLSLSRQERRPVVLE